MFSTLEPDLDNASVGTYRLIDVILPLGVVRAVFVYNSESGSQGARLHGFVSHTPGKPFQFEYFVRKKENES